MRTRIARDALLFSLTVLLGSLICFHLVMIPVSHFLRFDWTLTLLGRLMVASPAALLLVAAGVAVARFPRPGLSITVIVLALVSVPLLGHPLTLTLPAAFLISGTIALGLGLAIGAARTRSPHMTASLLPVAFTLSILGISLWLSTFPSTTMTIVFVDSRSPDGMWSLVGDQRKGGLDAPIDAEVSRALGRVIEQRRTVYRAEWGEPPRIEWVDSRTLLIDGQRLDIYHDPMMDEYR